MTGAPINEREIILNILLEITEDGVYSHRALQKWLGKYQHLDKRQRSFISRVCEGTLQHMIELDYLLNQVSNVKVSKMKPVIRGILRSAVYQLKYMDAVPPRAVCNEAVDLAVKRGFQNLRGFVNGVLRNMVRKLPEISYPTEPLSRIEIQYSIPRWILELWHKSYDLVIIEQMAASFQEEEKGLTIRANLSKTTPKRLQESLESSGVTVTKHPLLSYAFIIQGFDYLEKIPAFQAGEFYVQDISSMLVGELSGVRKRDICLDVCAAPGGKALHLAEFLYGSGEREAFDVGAFDAGAIETKSEELLHRPGMVEARDVSDHKVQLLNENIARSGLVNISARKWDARVRDEEWVDKADLVLADLPCSGLGVLGKKADLRYKAKPENLSSLVALQREILATVQAYVKPKGTLVYSTCTINRMENEENVAWFMEQFPQYQLVDLSPLLPSSLRGADEEKMLQLLPGVHHSDGFFISRFERSRI